MEAIRSSRRVFVLAVGVSLAIGGYLLVRPTSEPAPTVDSKPYEPKALPVTTADPAFHRQLAENGCDSGVSRDCGVLSLFLLDGVGGPTDVTRALDLASEACEKRAAVGCLTLARSYARGLDRIADKNAAVSFAARGCDVGEDELTPQTCVAASELWLELANITLANSYAVRGCTLSDAACNQLGVLVEQREGRVAARPLYERSCRAGNPIGCANFVIADAAG